MKVSLLFALLFCMSSHSGAQTPLLVQDIYPGAKSSNPQNLLVYNNRLYFFASDSLHGSELRYLDSTAVLLAGEVNPGPLDGTSTSWGIGGVSAGFKGKFYYEASPAIHPGFQAIYAFDGVNPPTIAPGCDSFTEDFRDPTVVGDKLYFRNSDLFCYNGLDAPYKIPLQNLVIRHFGANTLKAMVEYKGKLYFAATPVSSNNTELYCFDPADTSVHLVSDIMPGPQGSTPTSLSVLDGRLYFAAGDTSSMGHLFRFDGNSVQNLTASSMNGFYGLGDMMSDFVMLNGSIFFKASRSATRHDALYKFDTASKTISLVKDLDPTGTTELFMMFSSTRHVYFFGYTAANGYEVWRSDGTTCSLLADLNPGPANGTSLSPFVSLNGYIYFNGMTTSSGSELYKVGDDPLSILTTAAWTGAVTLHPNPATNSATLSVHLKLPQALQVSVYDFGGRMIYSTGSQALPAGTTELRLPLQNLTNGQYYYTLSGNDRTLASGSLIKN